MGAIWWCGDSEPLEYQRPNVGTVFDVAQIQMSAHPCSEQTDLLSELAANCQNDS
jgi:hypothetical protein